MSRKFQRTLVSVSMLLLVLTGCSSLQQDLDPPSVSVTGFRPVSGPANALNFEIDLRIVNPNQQELNIKGVAYTIDLEGRQVITGVGKDLGTIEGYSEDTITLTASAGMFEVFQLVGDLMTRPKDTVAYELDTKIDVGSFQPTIRVQKSGEINLQPPR